MIRRSTTAWNQWQPFNLLPITYGSSLAKSRHPRFRNAWRIAVIQMTFDEPNGKWSIALS
jgi:hypothetical protein